MWETFLSFSHDFLMIFVSVTHSSPSRRNMEVDIIRMLYFQMLMSYKRPHLYLHIFRPKQINNIVTVVSPIYFYDLGQKFFIVFSSNSCTTERLLVIFKLFARCFVLALYILTHHTHKPTSHKPAQIIMLLSLYI